MQTEINGDEYQYLTIAQRLNYLVVNLTRNLKLGRRETKWLRYCRARLPRTPRQASPGRALTEAFVLEQLPRMLHARNIRVLEIGCGSGSLTRLLSEAGFTGTYVGIDVNDRFDRSDQPGFQRSFVLSDANQFEMDEKFDLVISVSALEHIPTDRGLIRRLSGFVAPGGVQVHFVPTGWGLPVYLWHGYRQYSRVSLFERFGSHSTTLFGMGGAASFILHFIFITMGELVIPLRLRQRFPNLYGSLLDRCLRMDRFIPLCATMCAVCLPSAAKFESDQD